ncbi:MAG TPA: prolyl oligopeptidase family serine peptidase [Humisphaera sp.]|jgi:dienelactone hydrolase|nr:prolyl oligopeptidase family serine peptidase [Humisphaera sp.]
MNRSILKMFALCALMLVCSGFALGDAAPIEIREGLAIGRVASGGRSPVATDSIADLIARGQFAAPKAGDRIQLANGSAQWTAVKAGNDGVFTDRSTTGGYLACSVEMPEAAVMLLEAAGGSLAFVNGEARAGDPYSNGYLRLPVALHKGANTLLIASGRGRLKVRLLPTGAVAMLDVADPTLPDVLTTDHGTLTGAVIVVNTTDQPLKNLQMTASADGTAGQTTSLPMIAPMTVRKVAFALSVPENPAGEKLAVKLELRREQTVLDSSSVSVRVRKPNQEYRRTFVSRVDGSLQYYAVNPAQKPSPSNVLALTLHGAGVEAQGQADAYGPHDDVTLVAPTNRRPYGFDWEDIGRLDAIEVLELAEKLIPHDPQRVVLTGHSMGGHGTWHIGLTFPDRFAAIGPSAGWSSFASYGGGGAGRQPSNPSAVAQLIARANSPGDTLSLVRNSLMEEVYILHGDSDSNVPVREARMMRAALEKFHPRLSYHEEKGADHWWGSKCVDWPPMFAMFETVRLPELKQMTDIEFATANPAVSGRCNWATIEQQIEAMKLSTINLKLRNGALGGTTINVAKLTLKAIPPRPIKQIELDGQQVDLSKWASDKPTPMQLLRHDDHWQLASEQNARDKNAARGGPFKQAFNNHMMFVYPTRGNADENAAAYASARMLAESLYYRGNGAVDIVPDSEFDDAATGNRNVILFGNADINSAWGTVLKQCPIEIRRGAVTVGDRRIEGADLAALFVYPRAGSDKALVGAIGATGPAGMRAVDRMPLLSSGAALPDWMVVGEDALQKGMAGVRGAGYFSNQWTIAPNDSAWATP